MDPIAVIDAESARLAQVLAEADPTAPVPTCPDWTAADLLWHFTGVHQFWADVLAQNITDDDVAEARMAQEATPPATIAQMLPIRAAATAALLDQLRALDDSERRWTWWAPDQSVGFTRRMQVCEATMHRIDAELAAGLSPSPIEPALSSALVDQCVDVMWGWMADWATYEPLTVAEFVATDTGQRWLVQVGHWFGIGPESGNSFDQPRAVRIASGEPEVSISGNADYIARWAWGRERPRGGLHFEGDEAARRAVWALHEAGIQ